MLSTMFLVSIQISIQKWGNSAAIRLPAAVLAQLDLQPGDKLTAAIVEEVLARLMAVLEFP